jgi:hypothetical protein
MAEEKSEEDKLLEFLTDWGMRNEFKFVLPSGDDKMIDFININLKTGTIYADELNITEPLTEVG